MPDPIDPALLEWLLSDENPGVRLRTLSGVCGLPADHEEVTAARRRVLETFSTARDLSWMESKGILLIQNLTALAEMGLTRADVAVAPVVDRLLAYPFDVNCGEMMLLRALVMLGYKDDPRVAGRLDQMGNWQLPDGGWLCLHRLTKLKRTPKSCIKAAMHGLLLASELQKRGVSMPWSGDLIDYFRARRLFYRTGRPDLLVLNFQPGYRMIDVHFPIEFMRVGLPLLVEALAALGAGDAPEFQEAWQILQRKQDALGRLVLEGTLAKSYLPKERVGKPTRWGTLYAVLARRRLESNKTLIEY